MLAKEKWQVATIEVLERVFEERKRQMKLHGGAMETLPDGTGPEVGWLQPVVELAQSAYTGSFDAKTIQQVLRDEYNTQRATPGGPHGQLTKMHLVREELAEAFELEGDDPAFITELLQVAALCVQWAEYKLR